MTRIITTCGVTLTGMVVALSWMPGPAAAKDSSAADNWAAITKCATIADADLRHACSDEVLLRAGLLGPTQPASAESKPVESQPQAAKAAESTPSAPAAPVAVATPSEPSPAPAGEVEARAEQPSAPSAPVKTASKPAEATSAFGLDPTIEKEAKEPKRIDVTLQDAVKRGDGKFILTTTDGAIWFQTESGSEQPTPAAGDSMNIRKTLMGGFMCRLGKWPPFRCKRTS
jgi:hypothetical protein